MDNSHTKLEGNPKILKDLLRAKWSQEIKEEKPVGNCINKLLKWQVKSKKYCEKEKYTTLPKAYWKWYHQKKGNSWEEFNKWITKNYLPDVIKPVLEVEVIKQVLVNTKDNLKEQA